MNDLSTETLWDDDDDHSQDTYLAFEVGDEWYAIGVVYVNEIVRAPHIVSIPDVPSHVVGAINRRGCVMPVYDLRVRFGLSPHQVGKQSVVVVVEHATEQFALLVDAVCDVLAVPADQIEMRKKLDTSHEPSLVLGAFRQQDQVIVLIDPASLLDAPAPESDHVQD